ncbi:hypothetical protein HELRODRAFT_81612 [Helobdella robusta]|uniref:Glycerol-3-phosphate dehydrogenase [NAD(+)] n=1 Tax=Helobdella robusta TaxID=6412 RepID=T1G4G5_HELRO|nr:hypothetical protein HELRODRAFT_81612 [Helobdella robusta]ESO01500.1 hypothetical protein HELRODRAFT_81612 [Helobdella robusta]
MSLYKVTIIGSGNWGSVVAKLAAVNTLKYPSLFDYKVYLYVYEEIVEGQKLSEIINTTHVNVKYLKGHILPDNIVAIPDLFKACVGSDILVFVLPIQFIPNVCYQLRYRVKKTAIAMTMIKGFNVEDGRLSLISNTIRRELNVPCAALMGANIAEGVIREEFCEATIGCNDLQHSEIFKKLFETKYFRIRCVPDEETVEMCGALKNVIALAAGLVDGSRAGSQNTKATIIRLGFVEMIEFCKRYFPNTRLETFFESCAIADLIASSYGGRNRKVAEYFANEPEKTLAELEEEMLQGQKLQGPITAANIYSILERESEVEKFPIFRAVHLTMIKKIPVSEFMLCVQNHPQHSIL